MYRCYLLHHHSFLQFRYRVGFAKSAANACVARRSAAEAYKCMSYLSVADQKAKCIPLSALGVGGFWCQ